MTPPLPKDGPAAAPTRQANQPSRAPSPWGPEGWQPLLVYGTLLPGLRLAAEMAGARLIGPGTVPGALYDLGAYPGLLPLPPGPAEQGHRQIHGQTHGLVYGLVYAVAANHLARLDAVEEVVPGDVAASLYLRQALPCEPLVPTRAPSDWPTSVWAYVYNRPVDGCRPIAHGDYLRYLQTLTPAIQPAAGTLPG